MHSRRPAENEDVSREIIQRCQRGDVSALGRIYEVHGSRVYALCRRMTGREEDAEDATQQVFLRAFERIGTFKGRSAFGTWLHRLAVRHVLNFMDAERRRRGLPLDPSGRTQPGLLSTGASSELLARDEMAAADRLLACLPTDQRLTIVLREYWDLSYREMADVLEIPVGTVMSRLARARLKLKEVLSDGVRQRRME